MRGVKRGQGSTGRMKKHRYSHEFKVTAVKMANAHMESFLHPLKPEWIRGRTFATFAELEAALTAYIRFYNHHRLHSRIDYHTPEEYERVTVCSRRRATGWKHSRAPAPGNTVSA